MQRAAAKAETVIRAPGLDGWMSEDTLRRMRGSLCGNGAWRRQPAT